MKIISLNIKNLASIQGTYYIDFEDGALGACGLFCITGTTGSGKSTILDAISLALYGRTPRYLSALSTPQWQAELDPKDPRNMLHRGVNECFAEVVFLATDGYKYKSSWFCEISKKGKYKSPICRLEAVDQITDDIEVKSNKFEDITKEKIGLSYDQFSRTVLLAQNQFASFLKAKESDKSTLLEKLTGTEIYSLISIEIFNRKRQAEKTLKELSDKISAYHILTDDELSKLTNSQKNILDSKFKYQNDLKNLNTHNDNRLSLNKSLNNLNNEIEKLEKDQQTLNIEKENTEKAYNLAKESQKVFDEERKNIEPEVNRARILDERLVDYQTFLKEIKVENNNIFQDIVKQQLAIKNKKEEIINNTKDIELCDLFFKKNENYKTVFENYDTLIVKLEQAYSILQEINSKKVQITNNTAKFHNIEIDLKNKKNELKNENLIYNKLQENNKELRLKIKDIDIEKSQDNYKLYQNKLNILNKDIEAWSLWCDSLSEKNEKTEDLVKLNKKIEDIIKNEKAIKDAVKDTENAHNEQDKEVNRIALFSNHSVEQLRDKLEEGKECPLCGSKIHPFINDIQNQLKTLTKTALEASQKEKIRLDNARKEAVKAADIWEKRSALLYQEKQNLLEGIKLLETQIEEYSQKYANVTKLFKDAKLLSKEGQKEALSEMNKFLEKIVNYIKKSENNIELYNRISRLISQNLESLGTIQTKKDILDKDIIKLQENYTTVKTNLANQIEENRKYITDYNKQIEKINPQITIDFWLQDFEDNSIEFLERLKKAYSIWNKNIELKDLKTKENEKISNHISLLEEQLRKVIVTQEANNQKLDKQQKLIDNSLNERNSLLGGKSILSIQNELNTKATIIKDSIEKEKTKFDLKERIINQSIGQISAYKKQKQEKDIELENHINVFGPLENIQKEIKNCEVKIKELEPKLEQINSQLLLHKENLEQIESHKDDLDKKRNNLNDWNELCSRFGNASGDSFKRIAQEYTMNILLTYANKQLELLTNRYELRQVKNSLILNIIDHEMANAERTVNSLSGGETFLISLGLALGLSTLASGKIRIESLFIDEGFGSLDADTLRITLDALEQLQSQGRKVGVISHVEELKERISAQINIIKKSNGNSRILVTN